MAAFVFPTIVHANLAHKSGNRLVGKIVYLSITYELTEFIIRKEAKYSAVV